MLLHKATAGLQSPPANGGALTTLIVLRALGHLLGFLAVCAQSGVIILGRVDHLGRGPRDRAE